MTTKIWYYENAMQILFILAEFLYIQIFLLYFPNFDWRTIFHCSFFIPIIHYNLFIISSICNKWQTFKKAIQIFKIWLKKNIHSNRSNMPTLNRKYTTMKVVSIVLTRNCHTCFTNLGCHTASAETHSKIE